jgi:hypothetical protein
MPLTNADYNAFAQALANRFVERAKGLDETSQQIINLRPADHVLAGFLTPAPSSQYQTMDDDTDTALADDLPKDTPYEQSAIGLEWIAPITALHNSLIVEIEARVRVYVRRYPSFEQQKKYVSWRVLHRPRAPHVPIIDRDGLAASDRPQRHAELIPVWTQETLPPLRAKIDLGELYKSRRLMIDFSAQVCEGWAVVNPMALYAERRAIMINEVVLTSPEEYERWLLEESHRQSARSLGDTLPLPWRPVIDVRLVVLPTEPGHVRIALRLINRTERLKTSSLDYVDPNLYGVELQLRMPAVAHRPTIFRELEDSFRYDRRMPGVGINAHVKEHSGMGMIVLATESIPQKEVPRLEPREIKNAAPTFDALATDPVPILRRILAEMEGYNAKDWEQKIAALTGSERDEAVRAQAQFRTEILRFERGITLLSDARYPDVRWAFRLMNETMKKSARNTYDRWRLFQIIFIVSQLPTLAARQYPELVQSDDDHVDILWFAAGGGKTEAFLGLILWQAFFDRIRGKHCGVTALVRFPLRLLTFQQLERIGRALAAAEVIRVRERLSGTRFSLGFFVGKPVTPNSIDDEAHRRYTNKGIEPRLQRVFHCPFCDHNVRIEYVANLRLIQHVCANNACPGGQQRLPVYIVDDDIYRFLPTVVVSTVDKLAQIGQNQRFANIFGRFDLVCHRHGASFRGVNGRLCQAAKAFGEGEQPERCGETQVIYGPFHDPAPALLIQDEMHLLSEELGTFDAHYETGVIELARSLGAQPWKIITATATIENYQQHVWQLYLRRARQFPGPGPGAYESFYYQQDSERIGRIFVGLLGVGRKHTPIMTRALSLLYLELQAARDLAAADPAAASAHYGTKLLTTEEFQQLIFLYELPLTYVLTRKGSDQVAEAIESRVKKELSDLIPQHGELIIEMFNSGVDVAEMIKAMKKIQETDCTGDPAERIRGLVTTNIIGHGVDVNRFNVILFAGFTRLVAEYIQAAARVGRTYPGISILVVTPQSQRDRSIFDRFAKFHEYVDRLVDPSAITRWSEPALQRTVPGMLCAYLMGVASKHLGQPLSTVEHVQRVYGKGEAEALNDAAIIAWLEQAYGIGKGSPQHYSQRLTTISRNQYASVVNTLPFSGGRPHPLNTHLGAMRSLRDVDEPASIQIQRPEDQVILRRFTNG